MLIIRSRLQTEKALRSFISEKPANKASSISAFCNRQLQLRSSVCCILLQIFHSSLFSERQTYFTLRSFYTVFLRVQKCSRDVRVRFLTSSCNLREINYSNAEHERNKHSKKFLQKPGLYFLEKWYLKHFTFIFFRLLYCEAILLRVYNLSDTVSFSVPIRFTIF